MSKKPHVRQATEPDAPPPLFRSWRRFYAAVLANTFLVYLLLVLFSVYTK